MSKGWKEPIRPPRSGFHSCERIVNIIKDSDFDGKRRQRERLGGRCGFLKLKFVEVLAARREASAFPV